MRANPPGLRSIFSSALLLVAISSTVTCPALAQSIPVLETADLNGKSLVWPKDLPAGKSLLIVAFARDQQSKIDAWVAGLGLKAPNAPSWYEVPMIDNPGQVGRWFIDNGMRSGITDPQDRAHVTTIYGDKASLMKTMGLPNEEQVHLLVVDNQGRIYKRVSGDFSAPGRAAITQAMGG